MNNNAARQIEEEIGIFKNFCKLNGISDIKNISPSIPDIICEFNDGSITFYELSRITIPRINKMLAKAIVSPDPGVDWVNINLEDVLTKKVSKNYNVDHPIQLLLYIKEDLLKYYSPKLLNERFADWIKNNEKNIEFEKILIYDNFFNSLVTEYII